MSAVPRATRVVESCLYAEDLDATAEFYERVMGLAVASRAPGRHVFFRAGEVMFLLFRPSATAASTEVPGHGASGPGHVAFGASHAELGAWRRHLMAAGVSIEREVEWPDGGRSLYLRDPAGNSVELVTPEVWGLRPG